MDNQLPINTSWWRKRTKLEKNLIMVISFLIVLTYLGFHLLITFCSSKSLDKNFCMTKKCIQTSSSLLQKIDENADPCEDFYEFACGNFIKETTVPDEDTRVSAFLSLSKKVDLDLKRVFEEPFQEESFNYEKLVKTYYKACMNTSKIEKEGVTFIKQEFELLGGWPVLDPNWNEEHFDWKNLFYKIAERGWSRSFFVKIYIDTETTNSSTRILKIGPPNSSSETLKNRLNDTVLKTNLNYFVELAVAFGAERARAVLEMKDVIEFEIELVKFFISDIDNRKNSTISNNPIKIRELQEKYPNIPWLKLINNYLSPIEKFTEEERVIVDKPLLLEEFLTFLSKIKKRTLANKMLIILIKNSVAYLTEDLRNKQLEKNKMIYGVQKTSPRWKNCVLDTISFQIAVSVLYTKQYFKPITKRKVEELLSDIKSSFLENLSKTLWMDSKTKTQALAKAEKMRTFIGYPDEILNDEKVEKFYEGLELNPEASYFQLQFNISKFRHFKEVQKLRQLVQKTNWENQAFSYRVNAFYKAHDNTIRLPAAVLQDPFFDPERPQYMNYGAIGSIIGHEITHGFDNSGRQYDKEGNLVDWWEPESNKTFSEKSQCFIEQYNNYTVPEIEMSLNGVKNLGESIADNNGIKIAYHGYLKWVERNKPELMLPGLPYTPKQLFWISAATKFCTKYKKEHLMKMVILSVHSPDYFRVVLTLLNSDEFAKDFNCLLGSKMNPEHKCKVW